VALGRYRRFREEAIAAWIEQLEAGSRTPAGWSGRTGTGR
jgi:hypothetical protein